MKQKKEEINLLPQVENSLTLNHKDSIFRLLFNDKEHALELYNAISGTDYGPDTPLEFKTLDEVMMKTKKNDIAFLLDNIFIIMLEHQSTLSGNLPIRYLIYYATSVQRMFPNKEFYKAKGLKIPRPVFIVLYNGQEETEDSFTLRLSDNFQGGGKTDLQLEVMVYNINEGRNQKVMEQSATLMEYSKSIQKLRERIAQSPQPLNDADLSKFLKECIEEGILTDFLTKHGREVINMLFEEMTQEEAVDLAREDGYEDGFERGMKDGIEHGIEQGIQQGIQQGIVKGRESGLLDVARKLKAAGMPLTDISEITELPLEEIEKI